MLFDQDSVSTHVSIALLDTPMKPCDGDLVSLEDRQPRLGLGDVITGGNGVQSAFLCFLGEEVERLGLARFQDSRSTMKNVGVSLRVRVRVGHLMSSFPCCDL